MVSRITIGMVGNEKHASTLNIKAETKKAISNKANRRTCKQIRLQFFSDPFSPSSYMAGKELQRLIRKYSGLVAVEHYMGGLIPLWELYRNNGISTHGDMVKHWQELGKRYKLTITGDVWLKDPPHSSFPACIAFKAAQMQSAEKARLYLQRMQELLFLENKNISKWKYLEKAAHEIQLDVGRLKMDIASKARKDFEDDLIVAEKLGVGGFPTLIIKKRNGHMVVLEGYRDVAALEKKAAIDLT